MFVILFLSDLNSDIDELIKYLIDAADRGSLFVFASDFNSVLKKKIKNNLC